MIRKESFHEILAKILSLLFGMRLQQSFPMTERNLLRLHLMALILHILHTENIINAFADEDKQISDIELERLFKAREKDYSEWEKPIQAK